MLTLFRWLLRLFVVVAALALGGLLLAYWLASRSLVDYSAEHAVEGITAPVEIVRDHAGVPHIFGATDRDVFFGLGFAHAQDRLWQMTMLRRTAQGRLSELFGERTLRVDELMRRLDLYRLSQAAVEHQDADTRAALEAYAAGVNAWLKEVNEGAKGRGAPEFFIFSNEIAPWQPADSIAVIKLMGVQLSSHLADEVLRARLTLALPPARVADILPAVPGPGIAALPDYASLFPSLDVKTALSTPPDQSAPPLMPVAPRGLAGASNAWAAAPSRSASGGTLLANDPHLGFTAPSIWYLARLELSTGGVIGGTIPGVPGVLVGRSDKLGWGLTSAYLDDQDLFIEELDPDNPERVRTPKGFAEMRRRDSIIHLADGSARTITLRWTENGPVIPGRFFDLAAITPPGHVTSLSWTLLTERDTSMTALIRLMRAQSVREAIAAGALFVAPAQNLTLADSGGIAMKLIGAMPERDPAHQTRGRMPSPGWVAANRWKGTLPYSQNPEFINPPGGILGNTNNKMVERPFPLHVSYTWGDTQRIQRWRKLMQDREVHTRESFIEAQLDSVSPTARSLLPLVARELWFTGEAAPEGTPERLRQRALAMLADWNGEMNEHLPEPLIYAAWMRALQDRLIRDELGPLAAAFSHLEPLFIERVFRDVGGASAWCDIRQSTAQESCTDIARMALDDALVWIGEKWGTDLESLRWGDAHQATHDHQVLGDIPFLKWFVNIHQSTSGGDNTLMRGRTKGSGPNPFLNVHGAGYRGVYDFADPDASVFIISTGQSGHPLSRHYDDLGELWRRGEYIPMSLDPELARAAAVGVMRLLPEDGDEGG
ncbi:penicillin amidase [Meinhardsimonia xiamenensis]|jgi:penicillin amidase|uniref:Penicillin amidase n=1 Tax=Meinhardsimonia xiamenensis TaxID=990712 RepID=A0A1G9GFG7_9RHOB|nr:penicillin acylase family protein [Meinhardsimonia xiamenensis]PRX31921.1 penicillin amidase [Meinhardsimonia xiamenensis]SDK99285.1 penicillin amidase [Meinhardsimonia xiamenensis]